jgi:hypothetical protein
LLADGAGVVAAGVRVGVLLAVGVRLAVALVVGVRLGVWFGMLVDVAVAVCVLVDVPALVTNARKVLGSRRSADNVLLIDSTSGSRHATRPKAAQRILRTLRRLIFFQNITALQTGSQLQSRLDQIHAVLVLRGLQPIQRLLTVEMPLAHQPRQFRGIRVESFLLLVHGVGKRVE